MKKQDKVDIIIERILNVVAIVCLVVFALWMLTGLLMLAKEALSASFLIFG